MIKAPTMRFTLTDSNKLRPTVRLKDGTDAYLIFPRYLTGAMELTRVPTRRGESARPIRRKLTPARPCRARVRRDRETYEIDSVYDFDSEDLYMVGVW